MGVVSDNSLCNPDTALDAFIITAHRVAMENETNESGLSISGIRIVRFSGEIYGTLCDVHKIKILTRTEVDVRSPVPGLSEFTIPYT